MSAAKSFALGSMVVVLLSGVAAVSYARWTGPIAEGDRAVADNQPARALAAYQRAQQRFDGIGAAKQLFAADYDRTIENQLWALYRLGRYDEVIEKADQSPAAADPHYWAGCAFFQKAMSEDKPEARLGWMTRAEEELRRAVEAVALDWDTKYDFELVTRLAAELRKQPKTPPNQLMQLLRPQPKAGAKPARRVG